MVAGHLFLCQGAKIVNHIHTEMSLHLDYCAGFGIPKERIEATEEHMACTAYTRYVLDVGQAGDWLGLQVALAPCLLGYGAVAQMLHGAAETARGDDNVYYKWILNYVADDYTAAVRTGSELIESHAVRLGPSRVEELVKIFIHATKVSRDSIVERWVQGPVMLGLADTLTDGDWFLGNVPLRVGRLCKREGVHTCKHGREHIDVSHFHRYSLVQPAVVYPEPRL